MAHARRLLMQFEIDETRLAVAGELLVELGRMLDKVEMGPKRSGFAMQLERQGHAMLSEAEHGKRAELHEPITERPPGKVRE